MSADLRAINWTEIYDRLNKSRLALSQAATPTEETLQAVYRRRAAQLASRQSRDFAATLPVLVFYLGRERYGIPLENLAEVVPFAGCASLPGAPPELEGVVNLRGDIYQVVDLARVLGVSGVRVDAPDHILFLRRKEYRVGVTVTQVDQIRLISVDDLATAEEPKQHLSTRYTKGLMPDGLIVIDLDALLSHPIFKEVGTP